MATMKEAITHLDYVVRIIDTPIPEPHDQQILVKVVFTASNPKDWRIPKWINEGAYTAPPSNEGNDVTGIVVKVGPNVCDFKPGDRVAAYHGAGELHGTHAEYTIVNSYAAFHLPSNVSFEAGVTVPLAAACAFLVLYRGLGLPAPWTPATEPLPLIIYGASSTVGHFAIQLAQRSNIHPLICVAGAAADQVEPLIDRSKGDTIVDYRLGDEAVVQGLREAAGGAKLLHAFDVISGSNSYVNISAALAEGGRLNTVLPFTPYPGMGAHVRHEDVDVFELATGRGRDLSLAFFRYVGWGLQEGFITPHSYEVLPAGLEAIQEGLDRLRQYKASGVKFIYKISEP